MSEEADQTMSLDDTLEEIHEDGEPVETPFGKLISLNHAHKNVLLRKSEPVVLFGRKANLCDVSFPSDKKVSSKHMKIVIEDESVQVEDLSANGVFVNGSRIPKNSLTQLASGDEVSLVVKSAEKAREDDAQKHTFIAYILQITSGNKAKRSRDEEISTEDKKEDTSSKKLKGSGAEDNKLEENLICGICQEILYDVVSVIPCLHNFCAGCYSGWRKVNSHECPQCRGAVERLSRNHQMKALVDSFLEAHPEKQRPEEDRKELDAQNTINRDELYKQSKKTHLHDYDSYDSYDEESEEEFTCLECDPNYTNQLDSFHCPQGQAHGFCMCGRKFPLRPIPDVAVQCQCCNRYSCDQYARKVFHGNCSLSDSPLRPFVLKTVSEHTPSLGTMDSSCMNGNEYELQVLLNYLQQENLSQADMYKEVLEKHCAGFSWPVDPNAVICTICAKDILKHGAYAYRKCIPHDKLPPHVHSRPNCWYGRNCRTQRHNPSHASRLNHICDATRH
eukprot:GCRY01003124.1.p1 GENE.GCRY01003124.1~~GCRY01003124.1.p1  ORF type:complete len:504 (+),score=80.84 GCRY01003124.1:330-1841(+)